VDAGDRGRRAADGGEAVALADQQGATTSETTEQPRIEDVVREKREEILRIAERHGATNVRIFGSVARGEAGPDSDVDLLIDEGPEVTSWFPGGLIVDLEELLGRRVDIVFADSIYPPMRRYIMRDARSL